MNMPTHFYLVVAAIGLAHLFSSCGTAKNDSNAMLEQQLTEGQYGHTLNHTQVFSPDDQWIVYDTRNHDTHISRTCCIEKVNIQTAEVVRLYSTSNQTVYGPGVGAAAWNPQSENIIFIHGLLNCSEQNPYGFSRRFGAIVNAQHPGTITHAEGRTVSNELVAGALRGGTHAHSWSGDGEWISFTYNDAIIAALEDAAGGVKDLRTIGVMSPHRKVTVPSENPENFSGEYFSVVAATVTDRPTSGSDEIEKAFDECWIGTNGYVKVDGSRQKRAIAFQGHVRNADDSLVTEVFVSDIPDDITRSEIGLPLHGTLSSRPCVPAGLVQRRITFTTDRKFPGVQGPRSWLRSSPDGSTIYFLAKNDAGIVQIFSVPVNGGDIRTVTDLSHAVQSQFNLSPDGRSIAFTADNSLWIISLSSGESKRLTPAVDAADAPVGAPVWNHRGDRIAYNRYVGAGDDRYLQIFILRMN